MTRRSKPKRPGYATPLVLVFVGIGLYAAWMYVTGNTPCDNPRQFAACQRDAALGFPEELKFWLVFVGVGIFVWLNSWLWS